MNFSYPTPTDFFRPEIAQIDYSWPEISLGSGAGHILLTAVSVCQLHLSHTSSISLKHTEVDNMHLHELKFVSRESTELFKTEIIFILIKDKQ